MSMPHPVKRQRVVLLKLKDPPINAITCKTETTKTSLQPESNHKSNTSSATEKSGMNDGMRVLAALTITVALVLATLAVYLCFTRRRRDCNGKENQFQSAASMPNSSKASSTNLLSNKGPSSKQCERVVLRIPTPELEGDPEVPYADIVISVRGASTPDISQALYLNSTDRNEWWCIHPRAHLQAARSADMLHVPQARDVTRKLSTNSEYAIITYA
ncbi:hypothetical protein WMY93_028722 [Mugilogobius chulae]|uniref:Uncharacterized protein n=1 Tax=Mugilogobius chulae TaxID=88201 RepID=A0AAW0MP94_9GOBI